MAVSSCRYSYIVKVGFIRRVASLRLMLVPFTWNKSDSKYNNEPEKTSEHFVSPINLIILIIINYQLSIERSSLVFTSQSSIFFYTAPMLSLKMSKSSCTLCLSLKLLTARQRALSARLLFSDMYTRVKSSLCLRPFPRKECVQQKQW